MFFYLKYISTQSANRGHPKYNFLANQTRENRYSILELSTIAQDIDRIPRMNAHSKRQQFRVLKSTCRYPLDPVELHR